uniref:40S ribosomal protein S12 n=1 Tax=Peromyscus maniculatus bairdii TaxID=230844 RepID=A0A8C8UQ13_PERMB
MAEEGFAAGGVMDVNTALQEVLKTALILWLSTWHPRSCQSPKPVCVLTSSCSEPTYVKSVEALWAEHQINLTKVDNNRKPEEWVGPGKTDREGKPWKVVGCRCGVIKDYGKDSQAKDVIEEYFKCQK